jgi:molecular chaperone GrpE
VTPEEHPAPSPPRGTGGEPLDPPPAEPPQEGAGPQPDGRPDQAVDQAADQSADRLADQPVGVNETAPAHRPGGDPEMHPDDSGSFGEEAFEGDLPTAEDTAASDELTLARTALAERTLDLQRLQAEYLNYKRRVERDRELVRQNATFGVLSELLPVLDDIDRAREHGELEGGFKAVADSLDRIVNALGLTKFGAKGDEFDPNHHEALMHGHSPEVTTTTVDVVAHAGYRIGERVLRAAKVTVLDPE